VPVEKIHRRGEISVWDRIGHMVDPGRSYPLHTIFNPDQEKPFSLHVIDGIAGKAAGDSFACRLVKEKDADRDGE